MPATSDLLARVKLENEWRWTKTELARIANLSIRPADPKEIVRVSDRTSPSIVAIQVGPVALKVPERGFHRENRLYVYVVGSFGFARHTWEEHRLLETVGVSAETAYFRSGEGGKLKLVHGAHFDHEPAKQGHPVFHMQLRGSLQEYGTFIQQQFGLEGTVDDGLVDLLRTVRIASAQLDVFSLLLQIAADQLLPPAANPVQRMAFNQIRNRNSLCGARCKDAELAAKQALPATSPLAAYACFRARHWYPDV
jgi:hypothetical protein